MKVLLTVLLFAIIHCYSSTAKPEWDTFDKHKTLIESQGHLIYKPCQYSRKNVFNDFRRILRDLTIQCFKKIAPYSNTHFVFSPSALWQSLAAIAEGSDGVARLELFKVLELPEDDCLRNQFFQLAKTLEPPGEDVALIRESVLVLDEGLNVNGYWQNFVRASKLIETRSAPLKSDPGFASELLIKTLSLQLPVPNFEGNSIIVNTLDYSGLWSTAFAEAIVEKSPFFDDSGKKIGYVDLMKIKRRVRMTYVPSINAKILELPVGFQGRYRMLLSVHLGKTKIRSAASMLSEGILDEIIESLTESIIPLDVAIPRFRMTTEIDMRKILEDIGISSLWTDEEATRNISDPAALPSSYIQRSTVTFDTTGIKAPILEVSNVIPKPKSVYHTETGLDPKIGRDFIVDRPFYYGLFDSKTYTCLFCGVFSSPTYKL